MKRITQLKDEALEALDGNFGRAAVSILVYFLITCFITVSINTIAGTDMLEYYRAILDNDFNGMMDAMGDNAYVSLIQFLISIFFSVPLSLGVVNSFRVLLESKGSNNDLIANFFKLSFSRHYLHIVLVSFVSGLLIGLMIVPVCVILLIVILLFHNAVATVVFSIATLVYTIWIGLMYSQIKFIIIDNPKLDIIDTMRRSRHLMDGSKWRYILLELSFLGWIILGILTLCIGYLWLTPYINTTEAAFYCDLRDAEKAVEA